MLVKTFEGHSIKDAIKAVKNEFGADAVILSTSEKLLPGTNTKTIEVKAAAPTKRARPVGAGAGDQLGPPAAFTGEAIGALEDELKRIDTKVSSLIEKVPTRQGMQNFEGGLGEIKQLLLETLRTREGSPFEGMPDYLISLGQTLTTNGLHQRLVSDLLSMLNETPKPSKAVLEAYQGLDDYFRGEAIRWLLKRIRIAPEWGITPGHTEIHAYVGSSGSGKTSAIAKTAAYYIRNKRSKVLLISYDNARLAAAEQLRVYSKVLGCPFESAGSPEDIEQIILNHRDAELILIDTSGRTPKHIDQISDLVGLSEQNLPINFHVVLSITQKEDHLDQTVRGFSPLGISSLFFSKLDEAWTFGEIINISEKWSIPLSFFSTGQGIPDDLERATRERILERVLGL